MIDLDERQLAYEAISKLFDDKHDEFKMKVLETIVTTGVAPNDPIFILLAQIIPFRFCVESVERLPREIETILDNWVDRLINKLNAIEPITVKDLETFKNEIQQFKGETDSRDVIHQLNVSIDRTILEIRELINSIEVRDDKNQSSISNVIESKIENAIAKNIDFKKIEEKLTTSFKEFLNLQSSNQPRPLKANLVTLAMTIGMTAIAAGVGGWMFGKTATAYDPSGPRSLTLEEVELLNWAKSDRGKLGKQIMDWNGDYLSSGECEKDASQLGVTLTMNNKKATQGFCILWVKPYKQRNLK